MSKVRPGFIALVCGAALSGALLAGCSNSGPAAPSGSSIPTPPSTARTAPTPTGPASTPPPSEPAALGSWTTYHVDPARTGYVREGPDPNPAGRAWSSDLGGAVRGQPLVVDGLVIAATERDRVVALDPADGRVVWSTIIGEPLTDVRQVAGCGNIDPLGITGTPVIDSRSDTVYVVAEVGDGGGRVHHDVVGLGASDGSIRLRRDADPPLAAGESPVNLLQRAGLALSSGRIYVAFGGNFGDCGHYHGWVVGVDVDASVPNVSFEVAATGEGGAIWEGGGGPAIAPNGDVYVSTGNSNPVPGGQDPGTYAESVVRLSPELRPLASFKDTAAGGDDDLATGNPVLLPAGVFAVGKTDIGYLLRADDLSQIAAIPGVCGSDPAGGPAYDPVTHRAFVACRGGGIQVVDVAEPSLGPLLPGADSAPIVIGSHLWALDHNRGRLVEFDTATGTQQQDIAVGAEVPIFASPSAGLGLLLVPTAIGVTAFH